MATATRTIGAAQGPLLGALKSGAQDLAARVTKHLSPAVARASEAVVDHGKGSYVYTTDGQKHLDFACGIGVESTGHCHPTVVAAIQEQAAKMIHTSQNLFTGSVPMIALLDRLNKIMPSKLTRHFFVNSGSEAVENAIKIARGHTGKQNIICFDNSFHGRTYGAMALTTSKTYYRQGFSPLMPQAITARYPYCLHCKARAHAPDGDSWYKLTPNQPPFEPYEARQCCNGPLEDLSWLFAQQSAASDTAAVIIEPIMGEGGFLTPPPSFLKGVRQLCDKHGVLLILDEVQSGVGRTGKWWGHQHLLPEDMQPDIMTFAKGIASGFPLAGVSTTDALHDKLVGGSLGGTYGAGPLAMAAAVGTLDAIEQDDMLQNATQRGQQLVQGLVDLAESYPIIDIRGRGLMVAMEFGGPDGSLSAPKGVAAAVVKAAAAQNLLILSAGARESVRFLPALNVSAGEVEECLAHMGRALSSVFEKQPLAKAA